MTNKTATAPVRMIRYNVELTDTFGGEANYSWVRRATITVPDTISDLALVRRAKAAIGLTGCRCRRDDMGDDIALRPVGTNTIAFISYDYSGDN